MPDIPEPVAAPISEAAIADDLGTFMPSAALGSEVVNVELDATGYAQVLVVLAEGVVRDSSALVEGIAPRGRGTRRTAIQRESQLGLVPELAGLERYFTLPAASQDSALANEGLYSALQGVRKKVRTGTPSERRKMLQDAAAAVETEVPKVRLYPNLNVMLGTVDRSGFLGLQSDLRVQEVQAAPQISLIRPTEVAPAEKRSGLTWGLERISVAALWDAGITGSGVLIGHLDTGVDASHPALAGAVTAFAEFDFLGKPVANARPRDSGAHGTHTAGIIAGRKVGNTWFGVAPAASLASAIVIEGGNIVARVLAGMDWAVGLRVRVLNMSLGLRGYTPAFLTLSRLLRGRGVLPVFAVGNEGPGTSRSPGNYAEALSVGACDSGDAVADFSGSQRFARPNDPWVPDLVAPGVAVMSCVPGGRYAMMSGSSMATPHVAGLAALLIQAAPSATPGQIEKAIFDSCTLPIGMHPDRGNRGIPDAMKAFMLLTGSPLPDLSKTAHATPQQGARPVSGGQKSTLRKNSRKHSRKVTSRSLRTKRVPKRTKRS